MAEGAIALSYPEPAREGKFLGLWLTFRVGGQIVGGAINLGINANRNEAGSVSYTVYLIFIALREHLTRQDVSCHLILLSIECLAPVVALLLTPPEKVQRTDGVRVNMQSKHSTWAELKLSWKLFTQPKFLLIVPLISCFVYTESVMFTYLSRTFLLILNQNFCSPGNVQCGSQFVLARSGPSSLASSQPWSGTSMEGLLTARG